MTKFEIGIVTYKYKTETSTAYVKLKEIKQGNKMKFEKFSQTDYETSFHKLFNTKIEVVKVEYIRQYHLALYRHILNMNIFIRRSMNKTFKTNQKDKVKIFTRITDSDRKFIERMVKKGFMEFCTFSINNKPFKEVLRPTDKGQELVDFCGFEQSKADGFYFDMV
jgi:hypothetical protein